MRSRLVYDFVHNASTKFEPPYWVKGEDSAFGFFAHIAPFPTLTPIHWGWNIVHDGYEFRSPAERGLCTQVRAHVYMCMCMCEFRTPAERGLVRARANEACHARVHMSGQSTHTRVAPAAQLPSVVTGRRGCLHKR